MLRANLTLVSIALAENELEIENRKDQADSIVKMIV